MPRKIISLPPASKSIGFGTSFSSTLANNFLVPIFIIPYANEKEGINLKIHPITLPT